MIRRLSIIVVLAWTMCCPAMAVQPDEVLQDQGLESRARTLSRDLRCMVCQNQSIDDSDASLARDLRILVRDRLKAGDTDQQVLDYLTARYGEFVLLKPAFNLHTALLWLFPAATMLIGAFGLILLVRRQREAENVASELTAGERARLTELLASGQGSETGTKLSGNG